MIKEYFKDCVFQTIYIFIYNNSKNIIKYNFFLILLFDNIYLEE